MGPDALDYLLVVHASFRCFHTGLLLSNAKGLVFGLLVVEQCAPAHVSFAERTLFFAEHALFFYDLQPNGAVPLIKYQMFEFCSRGKVGSQ
jgi:hypothetical protein